MATGWVAGSSSTPSVVLGPYKMSTFGGSSYVEVRMLYSIYRNTSNYTVYYNVQFHRTNTGYTTGASTRCSIFVGSTLKAKATPVDLSTSDSTWKTAGSGSFSVDLGSTSTASITLGFATSSYTKNLDTSHKSNSSKQHYYSSPAKSTGSISIPKAVDYTACGVPTNLSVTDNGNSTVTLSVKSGTSGTSNAVSSIDLFITTNGSTPSTSNYNQMLNIAASASTTYTHTLDFRELYDTRLHYAPQNPLPVKFTARTCGAAGGSYYSALATVVSSNVECVYKPDAPHITKPGPFGDTIGLQNYIIKWTQPNPLTYTSYSYYSLELFDITEGGVTYYEQLDARDDYWHIPADAFTIGHDYKVIIYFVHYPTNTSNTFIKGWTAESSVIRVRDIQYLDDLDLTIDDLNCAVSSTNILPYRQGRETIYLDIGSGNVCHLSWNSPFQIGDLSHYSIRIYACDCDSETYYLPEYRTNNNEFYITSEHLDLLRETLNQAGGHTDLMLCYVGITAHSKYGELYNSASEDKPMAVYKASGICYVDKAITTVDENGTELEVPVIKRAIAFAKDADRWIPVAGLYNKQKDSGNWLSSGIEYETLVADDGEVVVDVNNEPILIK